MTSVINAIVAAKITFTVIHFRVLIILTFKMKYLSNKMKLKTIEELSM